MRLMSHCVMHLALVPQDFAETPRDFFGEMHTAFRARDQRTRRAHGTGHEQGIPAYVLLSFRGATNFCPDDPAHVQQFPFEARVLVLIGSPRDSGAPPIEQPSFLTTMKDPLSR